MEIFDAMNLIGRVDRERYSIQAFPAYDAAETFGMIGFAGSTEYSIQYRFSTYATFFQSVLQDVF